eukprot:6470727-Amphidinium_carterae.1
MPRLLVVGDSPRLGNAKVLPLPLGYRLNSDVGGRCQRYFHEPRTAVGTNRSMRDSPSTSTAALSG